MDSQRPPLNPEVRPSLWKSLPRLPLLLYRSLRWGGLRGGWLGRHLWRHRPFDRHRLPSGATVDVLVLIADHYEPARRFGDEAAVASVRSWVEAYEEMAGRHRDADGRPPQHTWFYRYDYPNPGCVQTLSASAFRGFGEIEFHLHHGHDTHASMVAALRQGLDWFGRFGAMRTAEARPQQRYGYVAGNWALDNGARNPAFSGCDTELLALRDTGCYADFTFPAAGSPAQPRTTNAIYYAAEDGRAKSYDTGVPLAAGGKPSGDLLIFQGPLVVDWEAGCLEDGALEDYKPSHPRRLARWLSAHVHVAGRPEWVFVKLHTHAMQNRASFLSPATDALFSAMETWWNRPPFRLHYVTAREAYNIARAAEAGLAGNPNDYRDYLIPPPANRRVCCTLPWRLLSWTPGRIHLEVLDSGPARIEFAAGNLQAITGHIHEVEAFYEDGRLVDLRVEAEGPWEASYRDTQDLQANGHSTAGAPQGPHIGTQWGARRV